MTTLLHHALADTTRANTHKAPKLFFTSLHTINDCTQVAAHPCLRGNPQMLITTYLTYRIKPASIKVYMYAVMKFHIENRFPNPLENCQQLQRVMQGFKST